ncbi:MAG: UTRA domain-containing protein [Acidihalobacter sp.]|uniref:UTRA domain-containing protein n=1 Tax=Acidihalobacter sp. TaxID=1872108 RepID=UPI00307FBD49
MAGYQEAAERIAARIAAGELKPGVKLGSERQLSEQMSVSRLTLRAALIKLEADGLVYGKSRRGWFVSPPRFVYDLGRRANYKTMAAAQERSAQIDLLDSGLAASRELPSCMREHGLTRAFLLRRVRHLDGRSVMFESIYLSAEAVPGLLKHNLADSITELLRDDYRIEIDREDTSVRSALLDSMQAEALAVAPATHGVLIERRRFAAGRLIEFDTEHWLPGAIEIRLSVEP